MKGTILIVDDDTAHAELLGALLTKRGFDAATVSSGPACLDHLRSAAPDVVITDVVMPGMSGIDLCAILRDGHPDLRTIVATGHDEVATAVAALRAGAHDFLAKPLVIDAVEIVVSRAVEHVRLEREVKRLRSRTANATSPAIVGDSHATRTMLELIKRLADSDANVLVTGESGTGKELVARALHELSPRRDRPFIAVNCAAVPAGLLESELFGHVRGAFTDASQDRRGLIVAAGSGTILLDEIGELPIELQVKLLRVLQERMVRPVGGDREVAFEARIITSTNRDLAVEVAARRFREDLYYRINVVQIAVPPLRDRPSEILSLAQHFIERIAARSKKPVRGLAIAAARELVAYAWPGNIRELENCMERAVALCRLDEITLGDLPEKIQYRAQLPRPADEMVTLDTMGRRYLRHVIGVVGGNKARAAKVLGVDRRTLYRWLESLAAKPSEGCS